MDDMNYLFRGTLCGALCGDHTEPLSDVTVRLYRHLPDTNVAALAVASPNDTFTLLDEAQIGEKSKRLIAETRTDAQGGFSFNLGAEQRYGGEAFEVDVYCGTVPHRVPGRKDPAPRQFSITTYQPAWKRTGEADFVAVWNFCISQRFWCYIRSLFDAWVICGHLTACVDGSPIWGAVVSAIDVDWLQDDPLGSAVTDANGFFRIDYTSEAFRVTPLTPWLNFESVGGPDVYFKATLGPDVILDEPSATGRQPGRENIGPCFCVELCSKSAQIPPEKVPHWETVWSFDIHPDAGLAGSKFSAEGYAGGPASSYVFGGALPMRGNCPLTSLSTGNALQYRFLYGAYTWAGGPAAQNDPAVIPSVAPAALTPVTRIAPTVVGHIEYTDAFGVHSTHDVVITNADLDANGWLTPPLLGRPITVDMHDGTTSVKVLDGFNFLRTDDLMLVDSNDITGPGLPAPAIGAGDSLTPAQQEPTRRYRLRFEVKDSVTAGTIFFDGLNSIILSNSAPVIALNMEELFSDLCNPLGGIDTAHVLYTVDHPHLNYFSLSISSNLGTAHAPANPLPMPTPNGNTAMPTSNFLLPGPNPNFFFRGGASGPHNVALNGGYRVDISGDQSCAYRVSVSWQTRVYQDPGHSHEILYCR
jgi:hypothetical protein